MSDYDEFYRRYNARMEDFWGRRSNAPIHERTIHIFGQPVSFHSNDLKVLDAALIAERMYSRAPSKSEPVWQVTLTVHDPDRKPGPPPARLVDLIHYAGADDWFSLNLGPWGSCFVDLARAEAHAVLASSLAEHPEQVCLVLLNTILTNFLTRHGYSMLHASALIKEDHILLLMAPHGTGKSTTALRLLANGYQLLSDSQVYIGDENGMLLLGGFPVGRVKLRTDILPLFPELAAASRPEPVRNETKHMVELDVVKPGYAFREMIPIRRVEFCLLERWPQPQSQVVSLTREELWPEIMVNSLHYNKPEIWRDNLHRIGLFLEHANLHRLRIGTSEEEIVKAVNALWA
jgi:hypothetical protein